MSIRGAASGQRPIRVVVARFLASYELFQALKSSAPGSFVNARASSPRGLEPVCLAVLLRREHELQQPVVVPCEFLSLHADSAEERLVEPEHVDDDVPEHGEVLGDVLRPRPRPVLVEVHVERLVHRLDTPVRAYRLERAFRVDRQRRDEEPRLACRFPRALVVHDGLDHADFEAACGRSVPTTSSQWPATSGERAPVRFPLDAELLDAGC